MYKHGLNSWLASCVVVECISLSLKTHLDFKKLDHDIDIFLILIQ